jgi:hypothetical protein
MGWPRKEYDGQENAQDGRELVLVAASVPSAVVAANANPLPRRPEQR